MDYKILAELLYPDVNLTIEDLEKRYPKRNLDDKAEVCRFAPSPTGRMHMGNLFASFVPERFAHQTNGVFILRIEDTDDKRAIDDGVNLIIRLANFISSLIVNEIAILFHFVKNSLSPHLIT